MADDQAAMGDNSSGALLPAEGTFTASAQTGDPAPPRLVRVHQYDPSTKKIKPECTIKLPPDSDSLTLASIRTELVKAKKFKSNE